MYDVGVHLYIAEDRSFPHKLPADFGYSWLLRSSTTKRTLYSVHCVLNETEMVYQKPGGS